MNPGRNEPCPCGSGKKYKKCCFLKKNSPDSFILGLNNLYALVKTIKDFRLRLTRFRPIDEAIVTKGGVCVNEINPKTMQSKLCSGLYFAGEVIDVDGYTGGFNLQIAFSTAVSAGENAAWGN